MSDRAYQTGKSRAFVQVVGVLMAASTFAGTVIFNDTFEGAGASTSGWFSGGPTPSVSTTVGADGSSQSLQAALRTAGTDQQFLKYFDSQTLSIGESITLQWQVRSQYLTDANVVRFGFYNSRGSRITTDVAYSNAALANYTGYSVFINNTRNTAAATLDLYERNISNNTLITVSAHESIGSSFTPAHTTLGQSEFSPLQTFTLTRTKNGWSWYAELGGLENNPVTYPPAGSSGSFADFTAVTNFDAVGLWYNTSGDVYLDNITVSRSSAPPPLIVGWNSISNNLMKMVINSSDQVGQYYLHTTTNLNNKWIKAAHSSNGSNPFTITNLGYSVAEGTNKAIYVQGGDSQAFFRISTYSEIPTVLPFTPGQMVSLAELSSGQSSVFEISDADRPGAWCWFQDERAIVDNSNPAKPILLTGVVTYGNTTTESIQRGDIDLYWLKLDSVTAGPLQRGRIELDDRLQMDDHASPAFMIRPDGRYLVNWSKHGTDAILRTRISEDPGDPTLWSDTIKTTFTGDGITYTNPHYLSEENGGAGILFNGVRTLGFDANFVLSDNLGLTWHYGGRTLDASDPWPDDGNGGRAYVKYAGDGKSKVHIFATDDHPHVNFNENRTAPGALLNSIYYAYIESNKMHRADGVVIDENLSDATAAAPTDMTLLLKDESLLNGDNMRRGWQCDIHVGPDDQPVGIFQFRANDNPDDHRYFYARYDGSTWHVNFLAYGGDNFGRSDQPDYTGLAAVDPSNPDVVYISTSSDPVTGSYLISSATGNRQHEIFMGRTSDFGATWTWAPVTQNSLVDNIRPIVPKWTAGKSVVLWMQGSYPSFYVYDTKIVGQIIDL